MKDSTTEPAELEKGARIAWTLRYYAGLMDGLSQVHRVYDEATTYCGEPIPGPRLRFPVLRSLDTCSLCASRHAEGWTRPEPEDEETLTTSDSSLVLSVA